MSDEYPRWDITKILNTDERACLYLKAAAHFDTGNGDTIRLAWRDIQEAHDAGKLSLSMEMSGEELSEVLRNHGLDDALIGKITSTLLMNLQLMNLPMAA